MNEFTLKRKIFKKHLPKFVLELLARISALKAILFGQPLIFGWRFYKGSPMLEINSHNSNAHIISCVFKKEME